VQVANGGFENGFTGWEKYVTGDQQIVLGDGDNSKTSAHMVMQEYYGQTGGPTLLRPVVPVCPALDYQLKFDYKIARKQDNCTLWLNYDADPPPTPFGSRPLFGPPGIPLDRITPWSTGILNISSYYYTQVWFSAGLACDASVHTPNASVFLDNFSIRAIDAVEDDGCPRPAGFLNGGFESGELSPWEVVGLPQPNVTYGVVAPGHNSGHMLRIDFAGPITNYTTFGLHHPQAYRCLAYRYTISFDYLFTNLTDQPTGAASMVIGFGECYNSQNPPVTDLYFDPVANWTHVVFHCQSRINEHAFLGLQIQTDPYLPTIPGFSLFLDNFQASQDPGQ
jgi:hypothetical protein